VRAEDSNPEGQVRGAAFVTTHWSVVLASVDYDSPQARAGLPGTMYRARKLIRRHRFGAAMATARARPLAVGLARALIGFRRAKREPQPVEALEPLTEKPAMRPSKILQNLLAMGLEVC
jgi:hypothetical protein